MTKSFLTSFLQLFARLILRKYRPTIVGITGSVGKTSTKEAIQAVLSSKFSTWASPKNYNNELGVPLSIIGAKAPGKSLVHWFTVFLRAIWLLIMPARYPAILILEMAADRPRDIQKLVRLAPPRVGVITAVSPVHTEFFGSIKRVAVEKRRLAEAIPKEGTLILNTDDEIVQTFAEYTDGTVVGYGIVSGANLKAIEIQEHLEIQLSGELGGIHFKTVQDGAAVPVHIRNALGFQHVYAALAAAAVGRAFEMNLVEISNALLNYNAPPGRMRIIAGVKGARIIDDSYNASPKATKAALETLGRLSLREGATRYAILADMLELGNLTEAEHREMGRIAAKQADVLLAVGPSAAWIFEEAVKSGLSNDRVFHFHTLEDGVEHFLQERIKPGDLLLIKGSQSMRMEQLVGGLMAEPLKAKELLCRQSQEWLS
ncbi:MAG: Alanine racemase [Parcubacteria group bacterium GW2011_GWA2_47_26]|nr:MAG: Alanine racemase [Parcubacteria group bacterium GW2011_GWA2_47_26]